MRTSSSRISRLKARRPAPSSATGTPPAAINWPEMTQSPSAVTHISSPGSVNSIASSLTGAQRVISVPLDSAHGLIGSIQKGDHVDVFAGFNVTGNGTGRPQPMLRLVAQGVPVVSVGEIRGTLGTTGTTNVALRVDERRAAELAFTADNGKLWLVVRPPNGARPARPGVVSVATVMLGVPPVSLQTAPAFRRTLEAWAKQVGISP